MMTSLKLHKQNESEEFQLQELQSEQQQQQTFVENIKQNSQEQESLSTKTKKIQEDSSIFKNLENLPNVQKQQITQQNLLLEENIVIEKFDKPQLQTLNQNMIQEKESQQIIRQDNVHSLNYLENQEQAHVGDEKEFQQKSQDLESQSQSVQKNNSLYEKINKRRNVITLSVIFAGLLVIALSLYFALKPGGENDDSSFEKSPYVVQRKFVTSKQQNYRLELLTTHNYKRNDSSNYTREIVVEYLFSMLIQNQKDDQIQILAFVDQTKQYEVGKQDSAVIISGARNFIDSNDSTTSISTTNQKNTTENQSINQSPTSNSTSDQDFPFSDDDVQLSRAEIIQLNVTKGGEIKDIAFPINVNETFLFGLPAFLTTLLPNLYKSNYDIIDPKGVKIVTKLANFTQKNVHGAYKMSVMQSHKSATGDVTLVQQFTQKTNDDYQQATQQQSNITFNNQGYFVKGRVESAQQFQYDNSTEDVLNNQKITQKFNVTFINETNISNNEKTHINNVFNMMSTVQYNWTNYLQFIENLKKTDIQLDNTLITSNQTEKPLVDLNQKVNISSPSTRMLTQNNNLLDNLQVKLFEKDILTIKMRSFISFKCDKQQDSSSNDECQTQVFLQFLGLNIPVSPIQKVNFPLTKFKNEVNWLKKNLLLAVSKIKNTVIDVVKQVNYQIDAKFNLAQKLFSNLSNPILNDIQKYASGITSSISVDLLDKLQKLQLQYTQILNSTQQKLGTIQNITSQTAQAYISTLQNNLSKIQQSLIEQSQKINQIYQNKTNLIYKDGQIAIQNVQQTLKQAYDLIQDKINIQIQQNLTKFVQSQQSTFINNTQTFLNAQSSKITNFTSQQTSKIQQQIIQLSQNSFSNIFQGQLKQISKQINDQLEKSLNNLQSQFNIAKQSINITIIQVKENPQIKSVLELKTSQNILNQINESQKAAQDLYSSFNSLTSLDSLYTFIASNFTSCADSINQEITSKLTNITDIFSNIAQQSILSFKDTITTLKSKTYDFSSNLSQQILDGVDNEFIAVSNFDKKIMDQSEQALQMLSADFSSSNFVDQVKKQMGKQSQILTDDISDLSLKSLNLTNLQDGNIFDFPVNSFISGIKDAINNGTDTIKNTIDSVKNVQNSFNDLSNQLSQIHQVALNFSQFENQFLNINKNFEDIVGQIDLQNLFQTITEDLKQDLISFVKSQILEKIQKQAIDQIKDKFQKLGNEFLKTNLNNAIAKLENVNKLFESAITKISSKFQIKKEQKVLFDEKMKFPQYPQPYYIPTPIGIPLVLQYYFQFSAQIFTFIEIQATSINAGFGVSANAEFDASAALSVLIAEIGAYAQGTIVSVDLQGLLSIQLLQKQNLQFIVDATFKAFNLKASIYISYIQIKLEKVCLFQRRMLRWRCRIGRAISNLGQQVSHFVPQIIKKYACIYVPQISKSDKIDILPALNIQGSQTQVQLVNINVG
ncbi:transmembrane protein, putative (macronuclear) [Tetrahymena thermophila SB210]|uniref:Transmembrane protein, putative n=1 Tax=Tetrahymena thermophila (strain SB210) TaxID=312017 RepID=Q23FE7_TETTS|nr:transmembrane protein, putative [Tetrahymena thermophila SB210]EAR95206.3 transmembrane protein, putative [Tetrahymena thermophila SB210]|eukprot:XP_001015451.3 transmembrane protein, putative [Tetrahymena thermophila SB210]